PIFLAGTIVLPLPLIRMAWGWIRGIAALVWILLSFVLAQLYTPEYAVSDRILIAGFLTVGGWILIGLLLGAARSFVPSASADSQQDSLFLSAWAAVIVAQLVLVYSTGVARYLLPLLPPLILLAFFKYSNASLVFLRRSAVIGSCIGVV